MMQLVELNQLNQDDVVDALMDLKHDLGKYLLIPFSMLSDFPTKQDVHEAIRNALFATRKKGDQFIPAVDLWNGFLDEVGAFVQKLNGFHRLDAAVKKVLGLKTLLDSDGFMDKGTLVEIAEQVSHCIWALVQEIEDGRQ